MFALISTGCSAALGAYHAAAVVSFDAGSAGGDWPDANTALGAPDGITGENISWDGVLSPFNPAWEADEIVQIGAGGHLTLRLERYATVGAGLEIGVVTNVGLVDANWPNAVVGDPAATLGSDTATVEVSENGQAWVGLGDVLFEMPANYYLDSGPYDANAGSVFADFSKPCAGQLSDYDGLTDYADVLAVLDGSGGGTWLDMSSTGLTRVGYIRFSVAAGGETFEIDAVSVSNAAAGDPVPEPATLTLLAVGAVGLIRRRRQMSK